MKRYIYFFLLISVSVFAQNTSKAFKDGEFLKFRFNYGVLNAGRATLEVTETHHKGKEVFHVKGLGWTTGMVHLFFPVYDDYQSYFETDPIQPLHFIRNIKEGGYTKNIEIFFNHQNNTAKVVDHKKNETKIFDYTKPVNDMLSSLYYMRSIDFQAFRKGDVININMFYDNKNNKVKLKYIGKEILKTKFGKVRTIVLQPVVEEGRIFANQEGVKIWLTDDSMKIPVKAKASILVGNLKMELIEYRGINGYLPVISRK